MPNYNKVMIMGHLTRDLSVSYLPNQTTVSDFGIAVNRIYKDKKEVCFIDCTVFGSRAETLAKYVGKGDPLFIEGRLTLDTWTAQDGNKRSKHKIIVESFQFLGNKNKQEPDNYQPQNEDIPF